MVQAWGMLLLAPVERAMQLFPFLVLLTAMGRICFCCTSMSMTDHLDILLRAVTKLP